MSDEYKRACEIGRDLEPDALEAWVEIGERLLRGQEQYGRLDINSDGRDWLREEQEELFDAVVYRRILAIQAQRRLAAMQKWLDEQEGEVIRE